MEIVVFVIGGLMSVWAYMKAGEYEDAEKRYRQRWRAMLKNAYKKKE